MNFLEQAQRIANYHIENSELTAKVVLLDDIYNEFSSGSRDITGIRDFIRHIYNTNSSDSTKLKFVCFLETLPMITKTGLPQITM